MQTPGDGAQCGTCGQNHEPSCTIGLRQQSQIQEQIKQRKGEGKENEQAVRSHANPN